MSSLPAADTADYFDGSKSAEEVGRVVANRVQTYLDEGL